jgi:hypothetical protein
MRCEKGQAAIELVLAVGIAIFVATLVGLFMKQVFTTVQVDVANTTNAVVNDIA